jgi:hypothetical protein
MNSLPANFDRPATSARRQMHQRLPEAQGPAAPQTSPPRYNGKLPSLRWLLATMLISRRRSRQRFPGATGATLQTTTNRDSSDFRRIDEGGQRCVPCLRQRWDSPHSAWLVVKRAHPLNAMVGAMLGLADEQIDSMWAAAADR